MPGWANINDGVLISMSRFKEITVKDDYVKVGAGNSWGEVYLAVEEYNATVAGARVFPVGVPGFLLGGKPLGVRTNDKKVESDEIGQVGCHS